MALFRIPHPDDPPKTKLGKVLYENGLAISAFALFLLSFLGHALSGLRVHNEQAKQHAEHAIGLLSYLGSGHFLGSVFENWQSEFLQMALFVWLTIYLKQKGSSESKDPYKPEDVDDDPREKHDDESAPWPVRRGGWILRLYEHSLSISLFALFALSWSLHAVGGFHEYSAEAARHGASAPSFLEFCWSAEFWFQTFQNWQSEFLSVFVLVVLSIFLRERGSAQSKPVAASHAESGG